MGVWGCRDRSGCRATSSLEAKECKFKGEWLEATVLEVSTWSADSDDEELWGGGGADYPCTIG